MNRIWGLVRTSYGPRPSYPSDNYRYGLTGSGVDLYILDSGVDLPHREFTGRATNGFVSSEHSREGFTDLNGHGTNVASLAGGRDYGIAKGANIINVKVLGANNRGTWFGIASGVSYVANRVRLERAQGGKPRPIINMSIYGQSFSQTLYSAVADAVREGIIVIVCAGNDAQDTRLHYPAAFDNTIAVGAIDSGDNFASFSNYGGLVDISAAGVRTWAAWSTNTSLCASVTPYHCIASASGTSMATPIVAGVVARYLETLEDGDLDNVNQETVRSIADTELLPRPYSIC